MLSTRLARALTGLLVLLVVSGCYTRLTHPKSAFVTYTDSEGQPLASKVARAILAPDYNRILRARGGNNEDVYRLTTGTQVRVQVYGQGIDERLNIRPDGMIDLPKEIP